MAMHESALGGALASLVQLWRDLRMQPPRGSAPRVSRQLIIVCDHCGTKMEYNEDDECYECTKCDHTRPSS